MAEKNNSKAEWNKTTFAEDRVKKSSFYEEKGFIRKEKMYQDRPIIGRDRKINGVVYLGSEGREAIVVDDKKDEPLNRVYQELIQRRQEAQARGQDFKTGLLKDVWKLVLEIMPYSSENVRIKTSNLTTPDSKIYLSSFIGGGICRHQSLMVGYLLERLSNEGILRGKVSVDRNFVEGKGGHAWVRYENSQNQVFILDPAQKFIGKLEDVPEDKWFYERPEDTNKALKIFKKVKNFFSK
jgi:hypothetical protein